MDGAAFHLYIHSVHTEPALKIEGITSTNRELDGLFGCNAYQLRKYTPIQSSKALPFNYFRKTIETEKGNQSKFHLGMKLKEGQR